jgi:hypothetical protein
MKNRDGFLSFFIFITISLNIIGLAAGMETRKTEQYGSPFLLALPISNFLWFVFTIFPSAVPEKTDEERKAAIKSYTGTTFTLPKFLLKLPLYRILDETAFIITLIILIIGLSAFSMTIVIAAKILSRH